VKIITAGLTKLMTGDMSTLSRKLQEYVMASQRDE
jgi:hypothetical protein